MPGRRTRKKSVDHRKPPLLFEESPVSILRNVPSPVYASDHPPTAKTIPADEVNPVWVSPQFPARLAAQGNGERRSRHRSGQRRSTRLRSRQNSGSSLNISHRSLPKGMIPLQFVGDKPLQVPSPVEDVSISDVEDACNESDKMQLKIAKSSVKHLCNTSKSEDQSELVSPVFRRSNNYNPPRLRLIKRLSHSCDTRLSNTLNHSPVLRRSTRLKEKLMREIMTSSPLSSQSTSKVLAYDTPEEEYGLTFRQRRRLFIKRMKRIRTEIISDSSGTEAV